MVEVFGCGLKGPIVFSPCFGDVFHVKILSVLLLVVSLYLFTIFLPLVLLFRVPIYSYYLWIFCQDIS